MNEVRSQPNIKICGLRDAATIAAMDGLAITEIGLMFAPSKRQLTIEQGAKLAEVIKGLHGRDGKAPKVTGVFVNLEYSLLQQLLQQVTLDIIQLHGQEPLQYYEELKREYPHISIWKVISIKSHQAEEKNVQSEGAAAQPQHEKDAAKALADITEQLMPYAPYIDAVLLDAPGGGTGKTFNWEAIHAYRQATNKLEKKLIVAGGLHEGNVAELLSNYEVDGVDVSSGVETEGVKDINKIKQFVRRVIEA